MDVHIKPAFLTASDLTEVVVAPDLWVLLEPRIVDSLGMSGFAFDTLRDWLAAELRISFGASRSGNWAAEGIAAIKRRSVSVAAYIDSERSGVLLRKFRKGNVTAGRAGNSVQLYGTSDEHRREQVEIAFQHLVVSFERCSRMSSAVTLFLECR